NGSTADRSSDPARVAAKGEGWVLQTTVGRSGERAQTAVRLNPGAVENLFDKPRGGGIRCLCATPPRASPAGFRDLTMPTSNIRAHTPSGLLSLVGLLAVGSLAPAETAKKKPDAAALARTIDAEIQKQLASRKIPVSPRTSDAEFLRRVYLDIAGVIPAE